MFWILEVVGVLGAIATIAWIVQAKGGLRVLASFLTVVALAIIMLGWMTPQGNLYWKKLMASASNGDWLVVDNSGGETMRHWILRDSYVKDSDQSDGWQFFDSRGNLGYVSGDAFVMRINEPLEGFLATYRQRYNIPLDLIALE